MTMRPPNTLAPARALPTTTPDANQGPLLGIFFTGPLGFVAGTVAGWLWGRARRNDAADPVSRGRAA